MKTLIKISSQKGNPAGLNCILFDGNKARATDAEVYAETTGQWQFDAPRLVKAKLVKAAMALNSKKPDWNGTMLNGVELTDSGISADDMPCAPAFTDGFDLDFCGQDVNAILKRVKIAKAMKDIRYYLNGLMFNSDSVIVATDGHRLHVENEAFIADTDKPFEVIIQGEMFDFMPKIDKIEVALGLVPGTSPSYARITSGSLVIVAKTIDGKFPDYRRVVTPDIKDKPVAVKFNGAQTEVAKKLLAFSKANKEKWHGMKLSQQDGIIMATNSDGAFNVPFAAYTDEFPIFGVNAEYIADAMESAYAGTMYLSGPNDSALFEAGRFQAVVMPMRV